MKRILGNLATGAAALALGMISTAQAQTSGANFELRPQATWRLDATAYAWFQGVNGDVTALGHKVSIDASPSDLMSYADFPVQGIVNVQEGRLLAIADGSWTPLTVKKSSSTVLPLPPGMAVEVKYSPVIATAEAGYRIADVRGYSIDGLAGARFWYLDTRITLTPSPFGTIDKAVYWFDPIAGARLEKQITPRLEATALGDIGGFGAGAQLDYQVVGALSLALTPRLALDGAWRQTYADFKQGQLHSKTTESGMVAGVTWRIL